MTVSILVPVYNASRYLRECVASIMGQTYRDLQVVLINDGSTDDSCEIMKELAAQDSRLQVFSQPNSGVAATRNRLMDKATGEFIHFVDSDDWIEPNTIEFLLNEQQRHGCDMVVFNSLVEGIWDREKAVHEFLRHREFRGMLWNKLIARHLLEKRRFDESVSYGEDALMVWEALQGVNKVLLLKNNLYHYRNNEDSLSRQRFNGKKFTEYTTWDAICTDTNSLWPQYKDLAHARFACEMTQVLRFAALSGYKHDDRISLLQDVVRRHGPKIRKTGVSSLKMRIYAWLVSHNYGLVKFLGRLVGDK